MAKALKRSLVLAALTGCQMLQAAPISGTGTWETTLQARDINRTAVALDDPTAAFFYDATLNITWLADMNISGVMTWDQARDWTRNLTAGGLSDWRLPNAIDSGIQGCDYSAAGGTDCGYSVQAEVNGLYNEWAHLYYITLGNLAYCDPSTSSPSTCSPLQPGWGLKNTAFFLNIEKQNGYWLDTEYALSSSQAWFFGPGAGNQSNLTKSIRLNTAAVRNGDVLAAAGIVPEPSSLLLTVSGMFMLSVVARLKSARA